MARKKKSATKTKTKSTKPNPIVTFFKSRQTQTIIGSFLLLFSLFLLVAFISFFFSWQDDQSVISQFDNKNIPTAIAFLAGLSMNKKNPNQGRKYIQNRKILLG